MEAILSVKNRHLMIVKVIATHLNLSFTSCGSSQFPENRDDRDIDFAISSYDLQRQKIDSALLIHSREKFVISFAAVKTNDFAAMLVALIRPVGWRVFACSAGLILSITLLLGVYNKVKMYSKRTNEIRKPQYLTIPKSGTFEALKTQKFEFQTSPRSNVRNTVQYSTISRITLILFRAHIDQCTSSGMVRKIFTRDQIDLQFLYVIWLFYCLLIATTYKSNLVQQLLSPTSTLSACTFSELLQDDRPIVGFGGRRPGEYPLLLEIISTEAAKFQGSERGRILTQLIQRYEPTEGRRPDLALSGKINVLEDEAIITGMLALMRNRYSVNHYGKGKDAIVNEEFWSVKYGHYTNDIANVIGRLVNGGITDLFRLHQEVMEYAIGEILLKVYFASFVADQSSDEDYNDDADDGGIQHRDPLRKDMKRFQRIKSRVGRLTIDLPVGPVPLTTAHFQILWILLNSGVLLAGLVWLIEIRTDLLNIVYSVFRRKIYRKITLVEPANKL
ncbi:uncharacterized protein LOC118438174 [Folsomia candida]|nr:uncharacterized protein LOC118438174 [Folsomia candida]